MKAEKNIIPISEFNAIIAEIVMNESVPFIYERVGEKYQHYLIDEFQDTSVVQWMNTLPLIENSLASGNFNMLVGDAKQSIYRWRNGEVEQFINLPKIHNAPNDNISSKEAILSRNFKLEQLDSNYRSKSEIVQFNNMFFSTVKQLLSDDYKKIYDTVEQHYNKDNTGGYVQIDFFNKSDENDYDTLLINKTIEIIEDLKNDGYQYSEMAIICRSNKDGSFIASELTSKGFPIISNESLLINFSPKVRFMLAALDYINNTDNNLAKAVISKFIAADNTRLFHKLISDKAFFYSEIHNERGFDPIQLKKSALYDICEEIIRIFNMKEEPDAYLQYFLDTVFGFTQKNNPSISGFLDWFEQNKTKITLSLPEGENAINILSVHKSKGLEFKAVIFPYAKKRFGLTKDSFWTPINDTAVENINFALLPTSKKQLANTPLEKEYTIEEQKSMLDSINLLYVAFTRAVDRLYIISGNETDRKLDKNTASIINYFLAQKSLLEEGKTSYAFFEKTVNKDVKEEKPTAALPILISSDWLHRTSISFSAQKIWDNEKMRWGTLLHTLLSEIDTENNINDVIQKYTFEGIIEENESEQIKDKLIQIVTHPNLIKYFDNTATHKNECDIILPGNHFKRPDKIVIRDNKATIIDYKTGEANAKHDKQIIDYAHLLKEMNYVIEDLILVYIDEEIEVCRVNF